MKTNKYENIIATISLVLLLLLFTSFLFDGAEIFTLSVLVIFGLAVLCIGSFCWIRQRRLSQTRRFGIFAVTSLSAFVAATMLVYAGTLSVATHSFLTVSGKETGLIVSASDTSGDDKTKSTVSISDNVINVIAKNDGCNNSERELTVVLTNNGIAVKFTLSYAQVTSVDGIASGTEVILKTGESLSFTLKPGGTDKDASKSGSITITNLDFYRDGSLQSTNFKVGSHGTYTVNGQSVTADTSISTKNDEPYTLEAQPDKGYELCAWISEKRGLLFGDTFYVTPGEIDTIRPLFGRIDGAAYLVNGAYYIYLDEAISAANNSGTVIVAASGTAYHSDGNTKSFTIPTGVTLLIPYDAANTLVTNGNDVLYAYDEDVVKRSEYRSLTLTNGTTLTVNGAISISSGRANQFIGQVGPYGAIYMEADSNITVKSGGTLYAWGYVFHGTTGSGTVTVESGGTVYEPFSIMDYPGSASLTSGITDNKSFPMRSYSLRNVEVPMTLQSGATEMGFSCLWGNRIGTSPMYMPVIASGAVDDKTPMFQSNGTVTKSFVDGRMKVSVSGTFSINALTVEIATTLSTTQFSSSTTSGLYFPSCWDITIVSGTTTFNDNVIMCEGSTLTINEGATLDTNQKNFYVLDATEDPGAVGNESRGNTIGGCWNGCSIDVQDVHGNYYTYVPNDAVLDVNGTLIASGSFYTSTSGACITSSEGTGKIQISSVPESTPIYVKATNSASSVSFTAAQLMNGDKSYTQIAAAGTYNYCLYDNKWELNGTIDAITVTQAPTCSIAGIKQVVCGDRSKDVEIPKTGVHIWTVHTQNGNIHTCACEYDCGTDVVLNVDYRLDDYLWFNGSTTEGFLLNDTVEVSDNIQTVLIKDKIRYFVKAIPADEIPDELTFTIAISGGEATFTVSLADYVASDETLKTALLNYGNAAKDYFYKTYNSTGDPSFAKPSYSLIKPDDENMLYTPFGDDNASVGIVTQGATIYFDEAMRLAVKYQISGADTNKVTIGGVEYTVVQVGLLVKELNSDWTMAEALTTHFAADPNNLVKAYLAYNTANVTVTPGGALNQPNTDIQGETEVDLSKYNSSGLITFDLKSADYASGFALRTYAVLQDKDGNVQCIYGKQYGYGLGAYVNAMYTDGATAAADKSFNNLLEKAWALAQAAQ